MVECLRKVDCITEESLRDKIVIREHFDRIEILIPSENLDIRTMMTQQNRFDFMQELYNKGIMYCRQYRTKLIVNGNNLGEWRVYRYQLIERN